MSCLTSLFCLCISLFFYAPFISKIQTCVGILWIKTLIKMAAREKVRLEIEGISIACDRELLMHNSDYFSAMFRGSFRESSLEKIELKDVDLKSFNTIIQVLSDRSCVIEENDLVDVLQTACMLQFSAVKTMLECRILDSLKPSTCLRVWKTTELLDISPLWLKAKCMALVNFRLIGDSSYLLELTLEEVCSYLGDIHLITDSEMSVFTTAMTWWYENHESCTHEALMLMLLSCVDFKKLADNEIREMQTYPDIAGNSEINSMLNCVIDLRTNGLNVGGDYSESTFMCATRLCNSKERMPPISPCMMIQVDSQSGPCPAKKIRYADGWNRNVVIYDKPSHKFRQFFSIGGDKIKDLAGYRLMSYKEFIILCGGEYLIGAGNWNYNFWTYNTFKEVWERRTMLPFVRRHFQSVVLEDCIFIIGGTSKFRVLQDNMFYYSFKTDVWSPLISLPERDMHIKCCTFLEKLFVVYICQRCGYFFDKDYSSWKKVQFKIDDQLDAIGDYVVFSDSEYFYIKGRVFLRFKFDGDYLIPVWVKNMREVDFEEISAVVSSRTVHTLYGCLNDDNEHVTFTLETFNLDTEELDYIFKDKIQIDIISTDGICEQLLLDARLFSFLDYSLVRTSININGPFNPNCKYLAFD